ncbi:hypothetical protein [Psychroserpens damuponensis]|uniref:hypothetical protein n=1 Tax=Psychroserpens damuponensis TaxID=943936 RepID=UPI00058AD6A5|nr:hypothetical protein [Psychroserpens damuponensis]
MDTQAYKIINSISNFLEGLVFGFCIVTLLAVLVYVFYKKTKLRTFITYSVLVAKNLAIFYGVVYTLSLIIYYTSKEFDVFSQRATGPYAWAYWLMLLRPLVCCALLQLFWIKKMRKTLKYITLITFLVLIVSLFSGTIIERFVIITASIHRDTFAESTLSETNVLLLILLYIIEKTVLFSALVFVSWAIYKNKKLD